MIIHRVGPKFAPVYSVPLPAPGSFSVTGTTPTSPNSTEESSGYSVTVYWSASSNAATYDFSVTPDNGTGFGITLASQTGLTTPYAYFYINLSGYPEDQRLYITVTAKNASGQSQAYGYLTFSNYPAP